MDVQETEKSIRDLQTKVASMEEALNRRYQIDKFSSDEIKDGVLEVVNDKVADSVWEGFFYHSGITPMGTISSVADAEDFDRFRISVGESNTLSVLRPTKMRVAFYFDDGTVGGEGCTAYITTAHTRNTTTPILATNAEFVGFKIVDGEFYIMSYNRGQSKISKTNITVSGTTSYLCEIRYYPRERADFFIDDKYVGSISQHLPITTSFDSTYVYNTLYISVKGSDSGTHDLVVDYYEFIQDRK
jgi:hypothetical protein